MNEPDTYFPGCALAFRRMREDDYFKNVIFRDIFTCEGTDLYIACDKATPKIV